MKCPQPHTRQCLTWFDKNMMFSIIAIFKRFLNIQAAIQPMRRKGKGALGARCDGFIGSPTNLVRI